MIPTSAIYFSLRPERWFAVSPILFVILAFKPFYAIAAPYVPNSVDDVIITLPDSLLAIEREQATSTRLSTATTRQASAVNTANKYLDFARTENDPRWYGYAQAAIMPWWNSATRSVQTGLVKSEILQFRHEFDNAILELNRIIELQPRLPKAILARANVYRMIGNFTLALRDCQQLLLVGSPVLGAHCVAQIRGLTGSGQQAIDTLASILIIAPDLSPEEKFEIHLSLATIAHRHNELTLATKHYQHAFAIQPRSKYLIASFSDLLIESNQANRLEDIIEGNTTILDQKIKRLISLKMTNPDAASALQTELERFFNNPLYAGEEFPHKDYADFLLTTKGNPLEALSSSLKSWAIQKEPARALLVLKCALAAGNSNSTASVIDWVKTSGLYDTRINALIKSLQRMSTSL